MVELLIELLAYLRERRGRIVNRVTVLEPSWGDTEGGSSSTVLEVVDFDALLTEIDAFGEELRAREKANG